MYLTHAPPVPRARAAEALGFAEGLPVFMGGGDAFVGLLGMGVARDGHFGLMTGSSNVLSGFIATAPGRDKVGDGGGRGLG